MSELNLDQEKKEETASALKWADVASSYWPVIRKAAIQFIFLKWLPRIVSGPWGWLATNLLSWSIDHVVKPLYDFSVRKVIVLWRKQKNNQAGKDVQESKTEDDFNSSVDNLP